jgi:hypothetical protein
MSFFSRLGQKLTHAVAKVTAYVSPNGAHNPLKPVIDRFEPAELRQLRGTLEDKAAQAVNQVLDSDPAVKQFFNALAKYDTSAHDAPGTDGALEGARGRVPAGTPLRDIPGVTPSNRPATGKLIYVNGAGTTEAAQQRQLRQIADVTGAEVVGVHNATQGLVKDYQQVLHDEANGGSDDAAVRPLADLIYAEVSAGRDVTVLGHSQGAAITAAALRQVEGRLAMRGFSASKIESTMQHAKIVTMGEVGGRFPDGPRYIHFINKNDLAPQLFGFEGTPFGSPGRNASVREFSDNRGNIATNHDLSTYLAHWS